jgi:GPI-anchor transamidase subunit S
MTSKATAPTAPLVDLASRRILVLSFWAILLLGLPFWWHTTTIERLALPKGQVEAWKSQEVSYSAELQRVEGAS